MQCWVRSMRCLRTSSIKVLEEMSETLKESFEVRLTSVLQSQFDCQCAVDDVNVGTVSSSLLQETRLWRSQRQNRCQSAEELNKKCATGLRPAVQSCEEDQFQLEWKESLQTKLTDETLIMRSNSIIDQNSTSSDDELNDESIDAEDSEDDAWLSLTTVSHAKLVDNHVTPRTSVQECWITSLQDLMHGW